MDCHGTCDLARPSEAVHETGCLPGENSRNCRYLPPPQVGGSNVFIPVCSFVCLFVSRVTKDMGGFFNEILGMNRLLTGEESIMFCSALLRTGPLCTSRNRSRNATVRVRTDRQTDRETDSQTVAQRTHQTTKEYIRLTRNCASTVKKEHFSLCYRKGQTHHLDLPT